MKAKAGIEGEGRDQGGVDGEDQRCGCGDERNEGSAIYWTVKDDKTRMYTRTQVDGIRVRVDKGTCHRGGLCPGTKRAQAT